jgi:hypothetical protein
MVCLDQFRHSPVPARVPVPVTIHVILEAQISRSGDEGNAHFAADGRDPRFGVPRIKVIGIVQTLLEAMKPRPGQLELTATQTRSILN